jgi:hypothetical protein
MGDAQDDTDRSDSHKVIGFDELLVTDTIWVQTKTSNYMFVVTDPSSRRGTLTGGFLGNQTAGAIVSGAMTPDRDGFDPSGLKTGSRAVFLVEAKEGIQRVITSVVIDLAQPKKYVKKLFNDWPARSEKPAT